MSDDRYALLAARVLQEKQPDAKVGISPEPGVSRERGIAVVGLAIAAQARRQRRRQQAWLLGMPLAAAAAVLLLVGGTQWARQWGVFGRSDVGRVELAVGAVRQGHVAGGALEPGQSVATGRGHTTAVEFESGTRVTLDESSELEYREGTATQRFGLVRGEVQLHVAKLRSGERLIVETPDVEVEVRGTVFRVTVIEPDARCRASSTRVAVTEGLVEVRPRDGVEWVHPGEVWRSRCPETEVVTEAAANTSTQDTVEEERARVSLKQSDSDALETAARGEKHRKSVRSGKRSRRGHASKARKSVKDDRIASATEATTPDAARADAWDDEQAASEEQGAVRESRGSSLAARRNMTPLSATLALQNELFAEAVAAGRAGEVAEALAAYEALITHYPRGPLVESALVGRMRLLAKLKGSRGRQEAARYLERFPSGFAHKEAERLLDAP